jgi:small subunit ribosomal protein S16
MLKIRLQRVGRKNIPIFRVLVTDSKNSTKSGKFLEILGSYNPVSKIKEINSDRVKYWISQGAQLTGTVHNFLVDKKIISDKKINVLPAKKSIPKKKEAKNAPAEKKAETPAPTPAQ